MFFEVLFKNYVLFLFLGIMILCFLMKAENNYKNYFVNFKESSEIEDFSKNEIQHDSLKTVIFKSLRMKNSKKKHFQEICLKYNLTRDLERTNFLYNVENRVLYCWIRKIASSSFTKIFSDLENRYITNNLYREVEFLAPSSIDLIKSLNNNADTLKFLIVRHPFERLVSSYRDRIEDNTKFTAQAWIYAQKIFYLTRPELFNSNSTTGSTLEKIFHIDRRLKLVPTFKEFITYLIRESPVNYDHHWNQYYRHCSLCEINYNLVLKLDDHSLEQVDYILSRLNLQKKEILKNVHKTRGGLTDFKRTCEYFKNIPHEIIYKLYEKYIIDFEMFDYKLEKYLQCFDQNSVS